MATTHCALVQLGGDQKAKEEGGWCHGKIEKLKIGQATAKQRRGNNGDDCKRKRRQACKLTNKSSGMSEEAMLATGSATDANG